MKTKPHQFAQKVKAGRGWLIVRNSATLADTDYEPVADEIVNALNFNAIPDAVLKQVITALRAAQTAARAPVVRPENQKMIAALCTEAIEALEDSQAA